MRFAILVLIALAILAGPATASAQGTAWQGRPLAEFLDALNSHGMRILYSSDLVTADMRLVAEPGDVASLDDLSRLLRPFGLVAEPGPSGSLLVTRAADEAQPVPAVISKPVEVPIPEIVVTSSLHRLDYANPSTHTYLDRDLATRIPQTVEESVRLTHRLPGTASGGVSTRAHVRGGEANETLFLLDGLRLYEPYHLKDFQAIATIVNGNAIGGMDFYSGAYPARYGDRMSGVLDIGLREPDEPLVTELGISFFNASILSAGTFGDAQQGEWLATARRGNLDLVIDVVDADLGSPDYQDYLAHVAWEFGPLAIVSANLLVSNDKLTLFDRERGEEARADYTNQVFWLKWRADWSAALTSDTIVALSDITDRRSGSLDLPGIVSGSLDDNGEFRAIEFRQDWSWVAAESWMLRFGVNLKDLDAEYRFSSQQVIAAPFDGIFDNQPTTIRDFDIGTAGAQYAAYGELRWRPAARWTVDLGLRWDQQNYTTSSDDKQYSPRAGVLYQPADGTEIRFGWGQYYQAQEVNELQVADGVADFFPAQRAEHFVLNVRQALGAGIDLGASLYRKSFRTIRPRFENAFNTLTLLPELQFDRVRVNATNGEAVGAEILLTRGDAEQDVLWWLGYAWSEVEDRTPGGKVLRSWDQTHAFKAGMSWRWRAWDFSLAGELHTGWPATRLTGALADLPGGGQALELAVSAPNSLRYADFHTLDMRISREFTLRRGELTAFLEVTNLYDNENPCCTEYSLAADGSLASREAHWLPLLPSLGILWKF